MKMRSSWALVVVCCVACNSEQGLVDPGVTPGSDPDPVICVGDPDSTLVCQKSSEFWDCTAMPNGDVKCTHKTPMKPDGTNQWTCTSDGTTITCTTPTPGVNGSGGWTCVADGTGTKCTLPGPLPPSGTPTGGSD